MFSQEASVIIGAIFSALLAITGFLSASAFNRLTRELDSTRGTLHDLDVRITRLEAVCATRHRPREPDEKA